MHVLWQYGTNKQCKTWYVLLCFTNCLFTTVYCISTTGPTQFIQTNVSVCFLNAARMVSPTLIGQFRTADCDETGSSRSGRTDVASLFWFEFWSLRRRSHWSGFLSRSACEPRLLGGLPTCSPPNMTEPSASLISLRSCRGGLFPATRVCKQHQLLHKKRLQGKRRTRANVVTHFVFEVPTTQLVSKLVN